LDITYTIAFVYGLMAFFTPCILPMLPLYFGYLAGDAVTNIKSSRVRYRLMFNALAFAMGVSLLNILMGFGAGAITGLLLEFNDIIRISGGVLMILFGLYFLFDFKLGFLEKERKIKYGNYSPGFFKSLVLGIVFSFGWTPCNGPIIVSILMIASIEGDFLRSGSLMMVYSAGFATVFLLSAFLAGFFVEKIKGVYPYLNIIKKISGIIIISMGVLMITNWISFINLR